MAVFLEEVIPLLLLGNCWMLLNQDRLSSPTVRDVMIILDPKSSLRYGNGDARLLAHSFLDGRSEEHTSELQSLMRISYAVFCLKKKQKECIATIVSIND